MTNKNQAIFKIQFRNQDQLVELYAHGVNQSSMMAFVEVSDLIFDTKTDVLIDPTEEKLKAEFGDVKCTYIPIHSIIRIDEVKKLGSNKIRPLKEQEKFGSTVSPFPYTSAPNK